MQTTEKHSKRQRKNTEKRERKTKNDKKSNNNNNQFQKNLYFVRKRIWNNLAYIVTFVLQFFRVTGYGKCSNKAPTPIQICIGLADSVLRPKIIGNILVILMQIFIVIDYYFFFYIFQRSTFNLEKKQKHYHQKIKSVFKENIWFNP